MGGLLQKLLDACPCGKKVIAENRTIHVGNQVPSGVEVTIPEKYPNNRIVSSKYTKWNFLPKNLFEQFHRIANFYFLCVALVELVIDSPVSPMTSILPLIFVVTVTAVKQGYEDWLRHKADKEVNNRMAYVVRNGECVKVRSMDIEVGDVVKVVVNEAIPCDLVMISSEDPEGECYITTANLDGETNLKTFACVTETRHVTSDSAFTEFRATIECQQPITDLYRFIGRISVYEDRDNTTFPLAADNVLLRGCRLKNTPFVYGCAIYTGQDTKISLNSKYKSSKFSRVERRMNSYLIGFLIGLSVYSAIWVGLKAWFYSMELHSEEAMWYTLPEPDITFKTVLEDFLAFMVLCNYIIPISMYVTIELQKFFGSMFFAWDVEMYDATINEPAKALTSDLNEELGQVEYLFTDKTGTLTENDMQFRQCSVNGTKYVEVAGMLCEKPDLPGTETTPLEDFTPELELLLKVLALCHTVRVDRKDNAATGEYSSTGMEYDYQASSPDEKALVETARNYGIIYHGNHDDHMEVTVQGELRRYRLLHVLEFDPTRKRMSVMLQDEDRNVMLMVKGAETAIFDRVAKGDIDTTEKHIIDYAKLGLRTLCIAVRRFNEAEFQQFDKMLMDARKALSQREEKLQEAYDQIERELELIGATGVEDRLQDGVPETLIALREAGIQVWVLTGDKQETAVNISYSAGHFQEDMTQLCLTQKTSAEQCKETLQSFKANIEDCARLGGKRHALVLDGRSLSNILGEIEDPELKALLQDVIRGVVTVLCCRMTPLQKALVVKLVKNFPEKPTTASIGDGANDVSMIQEAHVGLGIMGKEGRQAVRSSDYAFGRFRFLKRALLMHGHYFYWRICTLVQYSFYKNFAMITAQLYFTFFSGFSAQTVFDGFFLMFFNITSTSLPVLIYGLVEKHVCIEDLILYPVLYQRIKRNARLSVIEFFKWCFLALWHSLVFFFGCYFAFSPGNAPESDGKMYGIYDHGAIIMSTCVIVVNLKLCMETYYWNGLVFFGFILTAAGYYALGFIYSAVMWSGFTDEYTFYGSLAVILGSPYVWMVQLVLVMLAIIPDIALRCVTDTFSDVYRQKKLDSQKKHYEPNMLSISFTKRSGTLTISQTQIIE